ncbi:putative dash complex subunit ask1 [Phaeomoniella chlamydospora]|uniref:DASH complex subunit ASK1 n=1 Tax=Phaeomoniella chlamydospora TaxID=158046 RepID=A0A0G2EGW1_PHACM|nr:putative dash complex subunit ask1 [Phaeomoniella chlamydospora]
MSRAPPQPQPRSLTLTEELERLEQSITLTLQGGHTPVLFWKQFFESSANVSLSGYEEQPSMQIFDETATEESHATTHTTLEEQESYQTPSSEHISLGNHPEDLDLSNLTLSPSQSTPRAKPTGSRSETTAQFAEYPSPYEALRREVANSSEPTVRQDNAPPITPGKTTAFNDISMTPDSSPFVPPGPASIARPSTSRKKTDPLLHRILDKNYRVAATPLTSNRTRTYQPFRSRNETTTPATATRFTNIPSADFSSSPAMPEAPQINSEVFSSPIRGIAQPLSARQPRTPGVSILTPGRAKSKPQASSSQQPANAGAGIWDSDSDSDVDPDNFGGGSPPKTFQFHVPQSRLLKTPAREASRTIVRDLLQSAGVRTPQNQQIGGGDVTDDYDLEPEFDLTGDIDYENPYQGSKFDPGAEEDLGLYDEAAADGEYTGIRNEVTDSPSVIKGRGGNLAEMTF